MPPNWEMASAVAFALAGGWLASSAASHLAGRRFHPAAAMGACAVLAAWALLIVFGALAFALSLGLGWALIVLAVVDYQAFRLPDVVTLPLAAAGLAASTMLPAESVLDHTAAAIIGYLAFWGIAEAYRRVRGRDGLGLGDAKLAAAAGAWLGVGRLPSVLLLASLVGIAWYGASALFRGHTALTERLAFGVPLCLSIWIVWLYGPLVFSPTG